MNTSIIPFVGAMNMDDPNEVIKKGNHTYAENIVFKGNKGNMRAENVPGTIEVTNTEGLPSGDNICIGRHYDAVGNRLFYFNWNSNGNSAIYIYRLQSRAFQTLIKDGLNTEGEVLSFDQNNPITSIDIIYGDPLDGDILYYIDSLGRPTKININQFLGEIPTKPQFNPIKRQFIDVAKAPPLVPIKCCYENDTTVVTNLLKDSLFQFRYRYIYLDNEKSVWSTVSEVPLPNQSNDQSIIVDQTLNSRIALLFPTGDIDIKTIELAVRRVNDGAVGDWYIFDTIDKITTSSNYMYYYKFYNNTTATAINPTETTLLQYYVPQKANCGALLDGSVLAYGGITEGYDYFNPDISIENTGLYLRKNGLMIVPEANGMYTGSSSTIVNIHVFGCGTNGTNNIVNHLTNAAGTYVIYINIRGTLYNIVYNNTVSGIDVSDLLTGISAEVIATLPLVTTSITGNVLTIVSGDAMEIVSSYISDGTLRPTVYASYYNNAKYAVGLVYYDEKGRTNGVITNINDNFTTQTEGTAPPRVLLNINHRPPTWATKFQIVRTENLTYSKYVNWVSINSYYEQSNYGFSDKKYAYIDISNMSFYNDKNLATEGVISYEYTPGDRIRFVKRFDASGQFQNNLNFDYEILGLVNHVNVAGGKTGVFVKIFYPTSDISSTFQFDTGYDSWNPEYPSPYENFRNYEIILYNNKLKESTKNNIYYEFGKCYGIGNIGATNAYHYGDVIQREDLSFPAKVDITDGDFYFKYRNTPIYKEWNYTAEALSLESCSYAVMGLKSKDFQTNPLNTSNYRLQSSSALPIPPGPPSGSGSNYPHQVFSSTSPYFLNTGSIPTKVRTKGSIKFTSGADTYLSIAIVTVDNTTFTATGYGSYDFIYSYAVLYATKSITFDIDYITTVQPGYSIILLAYTHNNSNTLISDAADIIVDVIYEANTVSIQESYSDVHNIPLSSNGRALTQDIQAKQTYFSTLFRYGGQYQINTNINEASDFAALNFQEFTKDFGDIMRMRVHERTLRIFQKRKVGSVGVYQKYITNNSANAQLVLTNEIISPNNIQYYEGDYGINDQPSSLVSNGYNDYFVDTARGYVLRLGRNGLEPISEVFKMQSWAGDVLPRYSSNYLYLNLAKTRILGTFYYNKDINAEYICVFQPGHGEGNDLPGYTLSFDERNNAFTSFYSYQPDDIICANNLLISWKRGVLYVHNNPNNNYFYGTYYNSMIKIISNDQPLVRKDFNTISYNSNRIWNTGSLKIKTSLNQLSTLVNNDFENQEGLYYAALMKDENSLGGVINGDQLKGTWLEIPLVIDSYTFVGGSNSVHLSGINVGTKQSQRNL